MKLTTHSNFALRTLKLATKALMAKLHHLMPAHIAATQGKTLRSGVVSPMRRAR